MKMSYYNFGIKNYKFLLKLVNNDEYLKLIQNECRF